MKVCLKHKKMMNQQIGTLFIDISDSVFGCQDFVGSVIMEFGNEF